MPSKKRKYNARFPAGRIKKIMQTDEEVGKVAQAVPIIISRTLELFVESLLTKAMQVTLARNAKTLSPSHVKQCILAESRFDFLRDLVKNIPDVSVAEEKEMMSAESSPNSSRFSEMSGPPRRIVREDSNSSSSSDVRLQPVIQQPQNLIKRTASAETEALPNKIIRNETVTLTAIPSDTVIDLSKKSTEEKPRTANFYQETLLIEEVQHRSVITVNPTYASPAVHPTYTNPKINSTYTSPQPSTSSSYMNRNPATTVQKIDMSVPKQKHPMFYIDVRQNNSTSIPPPRTPVTPILNIDFSKNLEQPEIKVLDTTVANMVGVKNDTKNSKLQRQNSKPKDTKKVVKPAVPQIQPVDIDHLNSGNLQIDEDYDT